MKFDDQKQKDKLEEFYKKEEEDLTKILAERYEIPYINLSTVSVNSDALKLIPEDVARQAGIAVFSILGKRIKVIVLSPKKEKLKIVMDDLNRKGYKVTSYMASKNSLGKAWDVYKEVQKTIDTNEGMFDVSSNDVEQVIKDTKTLDDLKKLIKEVTTKTTRYKTSRILEIVLAGAIAVGASDIHIEPEENEVRMRFRLDGILQNIFSFKNSSYKFILSRVKLLSSMKLNIKKTSQDGRFGIKTSSAEVDVRVSSIPSEYGETIVMRILNPASIAVSFENLGIEPHLFKIIEREIKKPNGMILTTGPTGSGKTTTLYSILRKVSTPEIKVITIEDPIEYHLEGITQTQTEKKRGYTFLKGLRSALRQDPDIIMVGEIRDEETARVAVDSALTGHLVFSTLHTNNAAGVIPRLIDLGINPKIISSALNISLAQRLVRKLCDKCKVEDTPTPEEKKIIDNLISLIRKKREVGINTEKIWRAGTKKDCEKCGGLGYKGRIGIFEGVIMDRNIENIIRENPSEREIKKAALEQNILSMREDGILKILQSVTSIEELGRVVDLESEEV